MRLRELASILATVVITAALMRFPLLSVPSYEPGLVVGALACLLCCWIAGRRARLRPAQSLRWGLLDATPSEQVDAETRANLRLASALVILPLLILLSEALRSECRLDAGPWTFVFIAAPAALMGLALGTLAGSITRRPRRIVSIAALAFGLAGLAALAEALAGPRTFLHDIFLGPLTASGYMGYDTGLTFPSTAYWHAAWRILMALAALILAALVRTWTDAPTLPSGLSRADVDAAAGGFESSKSSDEARMLFLLAHHRRGVLRALGAVVLISAPFFIFSDSCGITSGRGVLKRTLSATAETEHFRIHFAPGSPVEVHLPRLAVELESSRQQITGWLGIDPKWKVDAWIHPDPGTLFELTGARGFQFAAPWHHEFHGVLARGRVSTLRHELVHVLAADLGAPPFHASIDMGLTEGLATALDEGYARIPEAHAQIAAAAAAGQVPDASELFSILDFAGTNMDIAYRSSASFVGWLLLTEGPAAVRKAYAWGRFGPATGRSIDDLDAGWRTFLAQQVHPTEAEKTRGRERFDPARHPAFHRARCARLGELRAFGAAERADLLAREGFADEAAAAYCNLPDVTADPTALEAAAWQRVRAGEISSAVSLATEALRATRPGTPRVEPLLRLRFRLLAELGRMDDARTAAQAWRASGLASSPEEIDLDVMALDREDLRERYFAAALAPSPEDARLLGAILSADPTFLPAMNLLLERDTPRRPTPPDRRALTLTFADRFPGPLAARRLLALSSSLEQDLDWSGSHDACSRALQLTGILPLQHLEAEDCVSRADLAPSVRWTRS